MKRIIELSENDYKALKEDGVQNHLALADTVIANSTPYEEKLKYFPPCEDCNKKMKEIRQAYDKMKAMERPHCVWIPVTYRPTTEEEEKELCEKLGVKEGSLEDWEKRVFTCPLPDDGQEILVSHGKYVCEDICSWDEYGCGLENNGDWDGIDAWMPKPEPYQEGGAE